MPVHHERSAGVIAFRQPRGAGEREFLLLNYGKHWDYPKGHLEKREDEITAAIRELREETGIEDIELIEGFRRDISYMFHDKRRGLTRKTVTMFLGQTHATRAILSDEHVGAEFLVYDAAHARLTYQSAKEALAAAKKFLDDAAA